MGCCGPNSKLQLDTPYEKVEKFNQLKIKLEQFLSNTEPIERMDSKKILDLLIKTSNQISEYETELRRLQRLNKNNQHINNDLIPGITQDIKTLKNYHAILNNLLKESDNYLEKEQNKISNNINEIKLSINNNIIDITNKEDSSIFSSEKNITKKEIYFKKCIRRNKKGILNKNKMNNNLNNLNVQLFYLNNLENVNESDKNDEIILTSENIPLNLSSDNNSNKLNLIFELENKKKVLIHAEQNEQFLNVIKKLEEKEKGYDFNNLKIFNEDEDISEKIKEGKIIKDFGLTDFHLIQVKF